MKNISFDTIIYVLLLFVPAAILADFVFEADPVLVFILSAAAIIPLAKLIGTSTEELAVHTGPKVGGLLNATLGNAAELIITIFAIREGLLDLVRASITGSIIGNLLLVMGLSLVLGGLKNGIQSFDIRNASMSATLLLLAVAALMIPSLFDVAIQDNQAAELGLSEGVAVVMIVLYVLYLVYTFTQGGDNTAAEAAGEVHHAKWSARFAVGVLVAVTLGVVLMSEILIGAVEHVTEELHLTEIFLGVIIIPLIGNIAEHLVAVQVAYKNRMELSMAISLGSSLQIALFVTPVLVFISLLFDDTLLLVFSNFELIALFAASTIAVFVAHDGESNWFEGAMLLGVYVMLGIAFYSL
jgi:Ca2+:H+ antiporter